MSFKIEKGIPIGRVNNKYPFSEMEVGDSFFVPAECTTKSGISGACSFTGRRQNKRFSVRAVDGGWRVWRLE